MLRKLLKNGTLNLLDELADERRRLEPAVAALARVPRLEAALREARQAEHEWRNDPDRPSGGSAPDLRAIELNRATNEAAEELRRVTSEAEAAQRRIREIDLILSSRADAERLTSELAAIQKAGDEKARKAGVVFALIEKLRETIERRESAHRANIEQQAERMVEARLNGQDITEGEAIANPDPKLAGARAELAAAQRVLARERSEIQELMARSREVRDQLLAALVRSEQLAVDQVLLEVAQRCERLAALRRVHRGLFDSEYKVRINDVAVAQLTESIRRETAAWTTMLHLEAPSTPSTAESDNASEQAA
jgi:hypothetical protein